MTADHWAVGGGWWVVIPEPRGDGDDADAHRDVVGDC